MPYALQKSGSGYYVITKETKRRHSLRPLPLERAKAQMRAMYAAIGRNLHGGFSTITLHGGVSDCLQTNLYVQVCNACSYSPDVINHLFNLIQIPTDQLSNTLRGSNFVLLKAFVDRLAMWGCNDNEPSLTVDMYMNAIRPFFDIDVLFNRFRFPIQLTQDTSSVVYQSMNEFTQANKYNQVYKFPDPSREIYSNLVNRVRKFLQMMRIFRLVNLRITEHTLGSYATLAQRIPKADEIVNVPWTPLRPWVNPQHPTDQVFSALSKFVMRYLISAEYTRLTIGVASQTYLPGSLIMPLDADEPVVPFSTSQTPDQVFAKVYQVYPVIDKAYQWTSNVQYIHVPTMFSPSSGIFMSNFQDDSKCDLPNTVLSTSEVRGPQKCAYTDYVIQTDIFLLDWSSFGTIHDATAKGPLFDESFLAMFSGGEADSGGTYFAMRNKVFQDLRSTYSLDPSNNFSVSHLLLRICEIDYVVAWFTVLFMKQSVTKQFVIPQEVLRIMHQVMHVYDAMCTYFALRKSYNDAYATTSILQLLEDSMRFVMFNSLLQVVEPQYHLRNTMYNNFHVVQSYNAEIKNQFQTSQEAFLNSASNGLQHFKTNYFIVPNEKYGPQRVSFFKNMMHSILSDNEEERLLQS